ncbi:MAG: lipoprotein-releasing ABC transporter permease subunit [Alphaproteobacteria bacterium]|nr:lipoprotein-releasing ABC transporter permease subunit [Alphaproteobacteria bacterium]
MIAGRYLRAKRQESFISVISGFSLIGIALGVATLITVMSVMNGFRAELLGRILGLNGHLIVQSITGGVPDYDAAATRIRALPGVTGAIPIIEGTVLVNTETTSFGALVRGIELADLQRLTTVSSSLSQGSLDGFEGGDSVILGLRLAQRLGLVPGMTVTLVAPKGAVTPFGTTPRIKTYRVSGTFNVGMSEYDQTVIFMPLTEAQLFFGFTDVVGGIEVMVTDPDRVGELRTSVALAAGEYARVLDWQQMNSSLFGALIVERNVMFLILTLIILVAALNIVSGLIMLVKDKGGDIAILRTMGASQASVMRIFFIAGAAIGVIGTFSGVVLGIVFSANVENIRQFLSSAFGIGLFPPEIYFLSRMPSLIQVGDVVAVVAMALTLSFFATLYPSWRAARLDPVEALRYE